MQYKPINTYKMTDLDIRECLFITDYNRHLEGLNDEIDGISDMSKNKLIRELSEVKMADLELDECLYEEFHSIKDALALK